MRTQIKRKSWDSEFNWIIQKNIQLRLWTETIYLSDKTWCRESKLNGGIWTLGSGLSICFCWYFKITLLTLGNSYTSHAAVISHDDDDDYCNVFNLIWKWWLGHFINKLLDIVGKSSMKKAKRWSMKKRNNKKNCWKSCTKVRIQNLIFEVGEQFKKN